MRALPRIPLHRALSACCVQHVPNLQVFHLDSNSIGDEGAAKLGDGLRVSRGSTENFLEGSKLSIFLSDVFGEEKETNMAVVSVFFFSIWLLCYASRRRGFSCLCVCER